MRTILFALLVTACSKSSTPPAPAAPTPAPAPTPVTPAAAPAVAPGAAAPKPVAAPVDVLAMQDRPCLYHDLVSKHVAKDPEMDVQLDQRFDLDGDGVKDQLLAVQWKADIRTHVFVGPEVCRVPAGTITGAVERTGAGTPLATLVTDDGSEWRFVDGRYARDAGTAPPALFQTLRFYRGVVTPDDDVRDLLDAKAVRAIETQFELLADFPGADTFREAARTFRAVSVEPKTPTAPDGDREDLKQALVDLAGRLDAAAAIVEQDPAAAWAQLTPPARRVYDASRAINMTLGIEGD